MQAGTHNYSVVCWFDLAARSERDKIHSHHMQAGARDCGACLLLDHMCYNIDTLIMLRSKRASALTERHNKEH